MTQMGTTSSLMDRMIRAARLNIPVYEEVEADTTATSQALTVVVIVALASGIGTAIYNAMGATAGNPIAGLIGGLLAELIGWAVWSYVMYFVGTRFFKGTATYGELLRTLGFAYSPGILLILRFIPFLGALIALVVGIWRLVTGFLAVRQALDLDNGNTIATIVVGVIAYIVVFVVISLLLLPFAALM